MQHTKPPVPDAAVPVSKLSLPESPQDAVPDVSASSPEAPPEPASVVRSKIAPDVDSTLIPL